MKVHGTSGPREVASPTTDRAVGPAAPASAPAPSRVSLSPDASFISSLRAAAGGHKGGVRADKVAQAKAAIANGTLAAGVDLDHMHDAILADL